MTDRLSSSEHPDGILIEEAAERWLPELYADWRRANEAWEVAGRPDHDPGVIVLDGWGGDRPAVPNPIKTAAEEGWLTLHHACRRRLATRAWTATAMKGSPASAREAIDGDFFLDAWVAMDGSAYARAGRGRSKVEIYGLRIKLAADLKEPERKPVVGLLEEAFPRFREWASAKHAKGEVITENNAWDEIRRILQREPGRALVRKWLGRLPSDWRAGRGTSPGKANRRK